MYFFTEIINLIKEYVTKKKSWDIIRDQTVFETLGKWISEGHIGL